MLARSRRTQDPVRRIGSLVGTFTPMRNTTDVAIVGGGILGMSIAFQVAKRSNLTVTVLEKGVGLGEGSTGGSSSITRQRYSRTEMVRIARGGNEVFWQK